MIHEELTLKGDRYEGKFRGTMSEYTVGEGSHGYEHNTTYHFWEGTTEIRNLTSGRAQKFLFETRGNSLGWNKSLEDSLLVIRVEAGPHYPIANNNILLDKKPAFDLVLGQMYREAEIYDGPEIIPVIESANLDYNILVEMGLVPNFSGQLGISAHTSI